MRAHYHARTHHATTIGQDVLDAAMLNLTDDAASMVAERAKATSEFRWPGFASVSSTLTCMLGSVDSLCQHASAH